MKRYIFLLLLLVLNSAHANTWPYAAFKTCYQPSHAATVRFADIVRENVLAGNAVLVEDRPVFGNDSGRGFYLKYTPGPCTLSLATASVTCSIASVETDYGTLPTYTNGSHLYMGDLQTAYVSRGGTGAEWTTLLQTFVQMMANNPGDTFEIPGLGRLGFSTRGGVLFSGFTATGTQIQNIATSPMADTTDTSLAQPWTTDCAASVGQFVPDVPPVIRYAMSMDIAAGSSGLGVVQCNGGDCNQQWTAGDVVTLSVNPFMSSTFTGFTGDCAGKAPGGTLTMDADKTCQATWTAPTSGVGVQAAPGIKILGYDGVKTGTGKLVVTSQTDGRWKLDYFAPDCPTSANRTSYIVGGGIFRLFRSTSATCYSVSGLPNGVPFIYTDIDAAKLQNGTYNVPLSGAGNCGADFLQCELDKFPGMINAKIAEGIYIVGFKASKAQNSERANLTTGVFKPALSAVKFNNGGGLVRFMFSDGCANFGSTNIGTYTASGVVINPGVYKVTGYTGNPCVSSSTDAGALSIVIYPEVVNNTFPVTAGDYGLKYLQLSKLGPFGCGDTCTAGTVPASSASASVTQNGAEIMPGVTVSNITPGATGTSAKVTIYQNELNGAWFLTLNYNGVDTLYIIDYNYPGLVKIAHKSGIYFELTSSSAVSGTGYIQF